MKKSIKIGLAVTMIALATVITVFGAELPVKVVASGDKSVNLYFGEVVGKIWVSLVDQEGHVFHSKRLKDIKSFAMQYDLNDLPDGVYVLVLERADQSKNVNLEINNGVVAVSSNKVIKPSVHVEGRRVTIELDETSGFNWTVSIGDMQKNIVFEDTMKNATSPIRTYDLSNLPIGEYVFELRTNGNSFSEHITLKK